MDGYSVDEKTTRWLIQYEYKNVYYSMYIMNTDKVEVEKIVNNLYLK